MLAARISGKGSPSLSQRKLIGASPRDTPQISRVRIPSAKSSWNENGSIVGGTAEKNGKYRDCREILFVAVYVGGASRFILQEII